MARRGPGVGESNENSEKQETGAKLHARSDTRSTEEFRMKRFWIVALLFCVALPLQAADTSQKQMPLLFEDDFESGLRKWEIVDSKSWALEEHGKGIIPRRERFDYMPGEMKAERAIWGLGRGP